MIELIREAHGYPDFSTDRKYGGAVSAGLYDGGYTLFQSPTYMNVSGKAVSSAWKEFQRELDNEDRERALLVILHDDLERAMGKIKLKKEGSTQGHNGITSIIGALGTNV